MTVREKLTAGLYKNTKPFVSITKSRDGWEAYKNEEARINEQFSKDLAAEHGITGHPKEAKLMALAWEHGHSCGLSEVVNYYEQFVELLK